MWSFGETWMYDVLGVERVISGKPLTFVVVVLPNVESIKPEPSTSNAARSPALELKVTTY